MLESGQDWEVAALITSFRVCFYFICNVPRETLNDDIVNKIDKKDNVPRGTLRLIWKKNT